MSAKAKTTNDAIITADSNKAEYESQLPEIVKQEIGEVKIYGTKPITLIAAGERLYNRACNDHDTLVAAGLPEDKFTQLKEAAGALRYAESKLQLAQQSGITEYDAKWKEEAPVAFELCETIKRALLYVFRDNPDSIRQIRNMTNGYSNSAKVQHLQNVSSFGLANSELLKAVGFDVTLCNKAAELSAYLGNLLGARGKETSSEARTIRDKAYAYLKGIVMEIRTCGQYVFAADKAHLEEYSFSLTPKRTTRRKKSVTEVTEEPALAQAA
jgi:hypothetical protein